MKRPHWIVHILYYSLSLLVYLGVFHGIAFLLKLSGESDNLGAVIVVSYGLMFFVMPLLTVILVRFSLLRWYVDPFAAALFPFFLCVLMFIDKMREYGTFIASVSAVNASLCRNGGEGWLWVCSMFLFGLAFSFSFARPEAESISYKLLAKLLRHNPSE